MAQHDYTIANGGGAAVRSDINDALQAIITQNSGPTEPTVTKPYMLWNDTTAGALKIRNATDTAWQLYSDFVVLANAAVTPGSVGTYMFAGLRENNFSETPVGSTRAGSALQPGSVYRWTNRDTTSSSSTGNGATNNGRFPVAYLGAALTGTWRLMGALRAGPLADATADIDSVSLWLRIA